MIIFKKMFFVLLFTSTLFIAANSQTNPSNQQTDSTQTISLEKEILREDLLYTAILRDSLHLSNTVISSILLAKQKCRVKLAEIITNSSLSEFQKADAHHIELIDTDTEIKRLMGGLAYKKYIEIVFTRRSMTQ